MKRGCSDLLWKPVKASLRSHGALPQELGQSRRRTVVTWLQADLGPLLVRVRSDQAPAQTCIHDEKLGSLGKLLEPNRTEPQGSEPRSNRTAVRRTLVSGVSGLAGWGTESGVVPREALLSAPDRPRLTATDALDPDLVRIRNPITDRTAWNHDSTPVHVSSLEPSGTCLGSSLEAASSMSLGFLLRSDANLHITVQKDETFA